MAGVHHKLVSLLLFRSHLSPGGSGGEWAKEASKFLPGLWLSLGVGLLQQLDMAEYPLTSLVATDALQHLLTYLCK